jgi:hypothetical protein
MCKTQVEPLPIHRRHFHRAIRISAAHRSPHTVVVTVKSPKRQPRQITRTNKSGKFAHHRLSAPFPLYVSEMILPALIVLLSLLLALVVLGVIVYVHQGKEIESLLEAIAAVEREGNDAKELEVKFSAERALGILFPPLRRRMVRHVARKLSHWNAVC